MEIKKSKHGKDNKTAQKKYLKRFTHEINDDMNTPKALATMWEVLKDGKLSDHDKHFLLLQFDRVFGFNLGNVKEEKIRSEVVKLAKERLKARKDKDWATSDKLRDKINSLGYEIADTAEGYEVKKR